MWCRFFDFLSNCFSTDREFGRNIQLLPQALRYSYGFRSLMTNGAFFSSPQLHHAFKTVLSPLKNGAHFCGVASSLKNWHIKIIQTAVLLLKVYCWGFFFSLCQLTLICRLIFLNVDSYFVVTSCSIAENGWSS